MIVYIQILAEDNNTVRVDGWHPWINSTDEDEVVQLAAHKWFREAGYLGHNSHDAPVIRVLSYTDQMPTYPNGAPKSANVTAIKLRKE